MDSRRSFIKKSGIAALVFSATQGESEAEETTGAPMTVSRPVLMGPVDGEISICWAVADDPAPKMKGWVEYGYAEDKLDQKRFSGTGGFADYGRIKNVRLKGLAPGKRVYYRCCLKGDSSSDPGWNSEVFHYDAFPADRKVVKFAVMNDTHRNQELVRHCIGRSEKFDSDFLVWNGDITNDIGKEQDLIDSIFMSAPSGASAATPLHIPRGNHDCRGSAARSYGNSVGRPHQDEFHYLSITGDLAVIVLDTAEDKEDARLRADASFDQILRDQVPFLKFLRANPAFQSTKKRVVFCHIPLWCTKDWGRPLLRDLWLAELEALRVDLIISGHTHGYEYLPKGTPAETLRHPTRDPLAESNTIPQLVGGGPSMGKGTIILGRYEQGKLSIQMETADGKVVARFEV